MLLLSSSLAVKRKLKLIRRLPHEVRSEQLVLLAAEVATRRDALEEAVVAPARDHELRFQCFGEGQVDRDGRVATIVLADFEAHAHAELVGRPARRDVDGAAVSVTAEQSALRSAQHLYALDLVEVRLEEAVGRLPDAVDVDADAGQAADVELAAADAAAVRVRDEVRHHDAEVATGLDAAELEILGAERLDRDGRRLQIRLAALRRHDDLFELRRGRERQGADDCRGQRGQSEVLMSVHRKTLEKWHWHGNGAGQYRRNLLLSKT